MELRLHQFELPLKHPFTISRGTLLTQPTLIVELTQAGARGFGEATTNTYYGQTMARMSEALENLRQPLADTELESPEKTWNRFDEVLRSDRFAQCALDQAMWDLWGRLKQKRVYELWGATADPKTFPRSNYTIGIDTIPKMIEKLREYPDWPIYKIKLGTEDDVAIIRELRKCTNSVFRVDANCGWSPEQTVVMSKKLKELNVEFIEQPLPAENIDGMKWLKGKSELPLIADESCQEETDVAKCFEQGFDGINIKLVKCGGLTPAKRMIDQARSLGLKVMVGCMTESSVGISAIAQLLPWLDYVDMDGAVLLAKDIASGVNVVAGECHFPATFGSGVTLNES